VKLIAINIAMNETDVDVTAMNMTTFTSLNRIRVAVGCD